jgi:putative two-component system response regulator
MDDSPLILTIDDDDAIRESFKLYLEDCDYRVIEAADGRAGIEMFRTQGPDLVLVDISMPELNGLEVLEIIHNDAPELPVLMVSGTGRIRDVVEAIQRGAWSYILKPVEDLNILLHAIEKELERARLIRENREYRNRLEEMVSLRTRQLESANAQLEQTRMQVIRGLGRAAEFRDNNTGKHVIRVSKYSTLLARACGLPERTVELIKLSSLMHDLGKIGTPDHILLKPDKLNEEEWQQMQRHCEIGVKILETIPDNEIELYPSNASNEMMNSSDRESELMIMAQVIAAYHHERWDGKGYPEGLQGEEIPIEARIVSLADVYDALSSSRKYKEGFSETECQRIISEMSGNALDPRLVELFFAKIDAILAVKAKWGD